MAKHGLPVYPIYDEMTIQADQTPSEIEWLLEHGMLDRSLLTGRLTERKNNKLWEWQAGRQVDITGSFSKSGAGLPLTHQCATKYQGKYIFLAYDEKYRGDDPNPKHYVARQYENIHDLTAKEKINFTERGIDSIWWQWLDWKPDLLYYFGEEVVYSTHDSEVLAGD